MKADATKKCPGCGVEFTLQQIIDDPEVEPQGMQFEDEELEWNMYYFNHECPGCGSTFTIPVEEFLPFITEPIPENVLTGSENCGGHCLTSEDLSECQQPCLYAIFRRFLIRTLKRPSTPAGSGA